MNVRIYGDGPYHAVAVHGGPGAAGSMKMVCEELSKTHNVIEALQTETTIDAQLQELKEVLESYVDEAVTLIGHSWGAMLVYMFASKHPELVKKIILVSSGSLEDKYTSTIIQSREQKMHKLTDSEREELNQLQTKFITENSDKLNKAFARYGALMEKLDTYEPTSTITDDSLYNYAIFKSIWQDAVSLRKSGVMHAMGKQIKCDVTVIHGTYDSHPADGIRASLENVIKSFNFILLEKCGHTPWLEKYAKAKFYEIVRNTLDQ